MARRELRGARVLLTGASSGIGKALALQLAASGAQLNLVARNEGKLRQLANTIEGAGHPRPLVSAGDVTDSQARQRALAAADSHFGGLDILINNAGVGALGRFEDADPSRLRRIMDVNFFAPAEFIRESLPHLRNGTRPLVVNIGSILGRRGIPWSSEYCASKFALQGLSESLRAEFARYGIDLLVVNPGTTDTDFEANRIERQVTPWPVQPGVSPAHVARATVRAMRTGRHEIVPNWRGKLLTLLNRLAPSVVDRLMARYG